MHPHKKQTTIYGIFFKSHRIIQDTPPLAVLNKKKIIPLHNTIVTTAMNATPDTEREFAEAKAKCKTIFMNKMDDYGTSWRVMRPSSLTDQIYIKARRIRSIQEKAFACVPEGEEAEFIGIVNYCVMALIQLECPGDAELSRKDAMEWYDRMLERATRLMHNKNHDYDEAWRNMRISSLTDIILQKLRRTKEIEDHAGKTKVSEGLDANYMDMANYALFALILLYERDGDKSC